MTFAAVPPVPRESDLTDWEVRFLSALKQNIELLTGQRDSADLSVAVLRGSIQANLVGPMILQQRTANGTYTTPAGVDVPTLGDYTKLLDDFDHLTADVTQLKATMDALLLQLKNGG